MASTYTPDQFSNFGNSLLAGGGAGSGQPLQPTDTTMSVSLGDGNAKFPGTVPFMLQLGTQSGAHEIVKCTARAGDTLTIVRGNNLPAPDTGSAQTWPVGTPVQQVVTAGNLSNLWNIAAYLNYNVMSFGAKGNGTTDDTSAIQSAITAAKNAGGGVVWLPPGVYLISSMLQLGNNTNGVRVLGSGMYATTIKWAGASGGQMAQILGVCTGNVFGDLTLDGASSAGIGLELTSVQFTDFPALRIINTTVGSLKLDCLGGGSGTLNTLGNHFAKLYLSPAAGTSSQQSVALWLDGSATSGADSNNNDFPNVTLNAVQNYTTGLRLGFADFNNFGMLNTFVAGTGSHGLLLDGTVSSGFPKNNYFLQANFASAPVVQGTVGQNWCQHLDMSDGASSIPTTGLFGFADNPNGEAGLIPFGVTPMVNSQGSTLNQQVTVTTSVNLVSVFGALDGFYVAHLYLRVTAAATITALAYTGDEGGTQYYTFQAEAKGSGSLTALSSAALAVGSYICVPIPLRYASGQGQTPVIQVTASVANAVYATASIVKVG